MIDVFFSFPLDDITYQLVKHFKRTNVLGLASRLKENVNVIFEWRKQARQVFRPLGILWDFFLVFFGNSLRIPWELLGKSLWIVNDCLYIFWFLTQVIWLFALLKSADFLHSKSQLITKSCLNWFVCQDFCFCQDFVSRKEEEISILRSVCASSSHIKLNQPTRSIF